ncbi:hypothetical protein [Brevibacillus choshinensis]|nr:hypothetical protein [Brevibacillus choshinensis]
MVVADRKIATTGSFNYSQGASTVNDEVLNGSEGCVGSKILL